MRYYLCLAFISLVASVNCTFAQAIYRDPFRDESNRGRSNSNSWRDPYNQGRWERSKWERELHEQRRREEQQRKQVEEERRRKEEERRKHAKAQEQQRRQEQARQRQIQAAQAARANEPDYLTFRQWRAQTTPRLELTNNLNTLTETEIAVWKKLRYLTTLQVDDRYRELNRRHEKLATWVTSYRNAEASARSQQAAWEAHLQRYGHLPLAKRPSFQGQCFLIDGSDEEFRNRLLPWVQEFEEVVRLRHDLAKELQNRLERQIKVEQGQLSVKQRDLQRYVDAMDGYAKELEKSQQSVDAIETLLRVKKHAETLMAVTRILTGTADLSQEILRKVEGMIKDSGGLVSSGKIRSDLDKIIAVDAKGRLWLYVNYGFVDHEHLTKEFGRAFQDLQDTKERIIDAVRERDKSIPLSDNYYGGYAREQLDRLSPNRSTLGLASAPSVSPRAVPNRFSSTPQDPSQWDQEERQWQQYRESMRRRGIEPLRP